VRVFIRYLLEISKNSHDEVKSSWLFLFEAPLLRALLFLATLNFKIITFRIYSSYNLFVVFEQGRVINFNKFKKTIDKIYP